ncbi:hypothetical protein EDD86DRAFT_262814 [Gorgonomyces haynaldii]|nr:hypothetical protein EDD86DRAFT_262814 [Gorgonomyces haynaldii]
MSPTVELEFDKELESLEYRAFEPIMTDFHGYLEQETRTATLALQELAASPPDRLPFQMLDMSMQAGFPADPDSDLEHHMFHLSYMFLQAIPLSFQDRMNLLSSTGTSATIAPALKDAMFATASIFSTHSLLYPFAELDGDRKLRSRIEMGKSFASRATKALNQTLELLSFERIPQVHDRFGTAMHTLVPQSNMDVSDIVRTMLALAVFSYGVGLACHIAEKLNVFAPSMDQQLAGLFPWTVDDMVAHVPTQQARAKKKAPADVAEQKERFLLWASCLIFDTYCSMDTGNSFAIDEREYPDYVSGWPSTMPDVPIDKMHKPTLARHTLWENTPHAYMFDKMSRSCLYSLYPQPSSSTFNFVVWLCVIVRRILRVVRSRVPMHTPENNSQRLNIVDNWWAEQVQRHPPGIREAFAVLPRAITFTELHDALLDWHYHLPNAAKAFESLETFALPNVSPDSTQYRVWGLNPPSVEGNMLCLVGFAYLHVPCLGGVHFRQQRYRLTRSSDRSSLATYSSAQVLMTSFRALVYMLRFLGAPYHSQQSDGVPAPVQYWPIQPLEIFIISCSAIMASKSTEAQDTDASEVFTLLKQFVVPTLDALSLIWPIASHYRNKLVMFMRSFSSEE